MRSRCCLFLIFLIKYDFLEDCVYALNCNFKVAGPAAGAVWAAPPSPVSPSGAVPSLAFLRKFMSKLPVVHFLTFLSLT